MANEFGDAPIEPKFIETMNYIAHTLDKVFNGTKEGDERDTGFILLVFPYGEKEGRCNYISNGANREDVVKLFQEQIKRFENG
jgi:hypothetical protein